MVMNREHETLRAKLALCAKLAIEFPGGITAKNLRELMEEIAQQLRALEK
jgi:hypothetical protein